ncbi:MAG: guanylate kinase, partial [Clostridiales bacterium]|nr:guanylate kinase [Clostridiales bacterium]
YIILGTLESYEKIQNYYGKGTLIPIYIEVEDGERLERALKRERKQKNPKYTEMCRRFLADEKDFSEDNIVRLGIRKRYENIDKEACIQEIVSDIKEITDLL